MADPVVAVDVGGTNIRAAVVDRQLEQHARTHRLLDKSSPSALLEAIASAVAQVIATCPNAAGIGVSMKGLVDHTTGTMVQSTSLGMTGLPVKAFLEARFGLLAAVENDVHTATIGENHLGAGRRYRDFIYLNVGTGIAAGLILNGALYRGAANLAGEFGHNTVDVHGWPCPCGMRGCLEEFASGPGVAEQVRLLAGTYPHTSLAPLIAIGRTRATDVWKAADLGDDLARRVLGDTVLHLGAGLVNLVNMLNPEAIILGGGAFDEAGVLARRLDEFVRTRAMHVPAASIREIALSTLGSNEVGLLGAASLIWEYRSLFPPT